MKDGNGEHGKGTQRIYRDRHAVPCERHHGSIYVNLKQSAPAEMYSPDQS